MITTDLIKKMKLHEPIVASDVQSYQHPDIFLHVLQTGANFNIDNPKFLIQLAVLIVLIEKLEYIDTIVQRFKNFIDEFSVGQEEEMYKSFIHIVLMHFHGKCTDSFVDTIRSMIYREVIHIV